MKSTFAAALCLAAAPFAFAQTDNPDPVREIVDWNGHEVVSGELLVGFTQNTPASIQREIIAASGEELLWAISEDLVKVSVGEGNSIDGIIAFFEQFESVSYAEPNALMYTTVVPNDNRWGSQWGPQFIDAPAGWDIAKGSAAVAVSVIDTGIRHTHTDLNDKYAYGWDYYAGDSNPNDTGGHGTHCSGIAAAETNNNNGIAGIGWDTPIYAYRCGASVSLDIGALAAALNDSRNKGVHVTSNSWGGGDWSSIRNAFSSNHNAGMVNVAAAGNNGSSQRFYPAAYDTVLAVASNTQSGARSGFSNYGSWVDVAAPGSSIFSTWNNSNTSYATLDGTSMACPHVAGLAAVLYDMTDGARNTTNRDLVWDTIRDTSNDVSWVDKGIVDMEAAVTAIDGGGGGGPPPGNCIDPVIYGQATPGSLGAPVLGFSGGWPSFGNSNYTISVSNMLPGVQGTVIIGFDRAAVPGPPFFVNVDLGGPPPPVIIPMVFNGSGEASLTVGIPNNPFIEGLKFNAQWTCLDFGAQWGVAASEGMESVVCDPNG